MKKLIALVSILYLSRFYKPGDELPAYDQSMVSAWIDAGSAYWREDIKDEKPEDEEPEDKEPEDEEPKDEEPKVEESEELNNASAQAKNKSSDSDKKKQKGSESK